MFLGARDGFEPARKYDGVGKWRSKETGRPINAEGKLSDGTEFDGMPGLRHLLLTSRRDYFVQIVTERLLTYALGCGTI
jgi:hypothetical protein